VSVTFLCLPKEKQPKEKARRPLRSDTHSRLISRTCQPSRKSIALRRAGRRRPRACELVSNKDQVK
jgi:hypothetical protein